jgi:endonuclease-8
MRGAWHRYRPGEPWRRPATRASLVLEVEGAVAVCFDAPTVELFDGRAERIHPGLADLGPDLLDPGFDLEAAVRRLAAPDLVGRPIAEVLLDQRVVAGIGNVYKSEVCFVEAVDPFSPVEALPPPTLRAILETARRFLLANARPGAPARRRTTTSVDGAAVGGSLWVYRRAGRPCRRCGTPIASRSHGDPPRRTYWCPRCQGRPIEPGEAPPIAPIAAPPIAPGAAPPIAPGKEPPIAPGAAPPIGANPATIDPMPTSDPPPTIEVTAEPQPGGEWLCRVIVADARSRTEHRVRVSQADLERLAPGSAEPTDLVRRSFAFLLEREPKESILRTFDLPVIGRYFPEYEATIRRP